MSDTYYLTIGDAPCNLYTGDDGQQGHLVEGTGPDGPKYTVQFICDWPERNNLIAGLVGTVDYQGGAIVRTAPFFYPVSSYDQQPFPVTGIQGMFPNRIFCTACPEVRGIKWARDDSGSVSGLAGWGYFTYAVVTAEFTSPPYLVESAGTVGFNDLVNQLYCRSKLRVNGEVYSPPGNAARWTEGTRSGQPVNDVNVGIQRPRYELSVTRMRMPIVPSSTLDSMIGTVNETTIRIGQNTVSPDAALFVGYNVEERSDPYHGGIVYDIEMLWAVNGFIYERNADGNWNWFVDPAGDWSAIGYPNEEDSFSPPFDEAEHNNLFSNAIS